MGKRWTDERVKELKKLWADGLGASEIAIKMGGVTKNAVIGKVNRLELSDRKTPKKPETGGQKAQSVSKREKENTRQNGSASRANPTHRERTIQESQALKPSTRKDFKTCQWPSGDYLKGDFELCGRPVEQRSYCSDHLEASKPKDENTRGRKRNP